MSDIATMMQAANPVPDSEAALTDDDFDALLLLTQSRSGNVEVQELTKPVEPEKNQRRGWMVAAAAFAAVIVLVGAAMLLTNTTEELPPATTPPTTQAVAPTTVPVVEEEALTPTTVIVEESAPTTIAAPVLDEESVAFVEAMVAELNAGDYEAAGARILAAGEFRVSGMLNDPRTYVAGSYHYWTEMNSTVEVAECSTSSTSGITRCILSRTSELEPFYPEPETTVFQLRVEDGAIAFGSQDPEQTAPWWPIYTDFKMWVRENHPGSEGSLDNFTDAPAAAALTKEYVAEWRASLEG